MRLALLALGLPALCAAQGPARSASFVAPDGVRLRYLEQGSGPPLVLIHGFALSAEMNWVGPGALDSLAAAFRVIAPDLRGHGQSDKPHDPAAYGTRLVDDVIALLDHLGVARAHVAGYSLGGSIALRLATSHPDRVLSAVLGGSGWTPPGRAPPPFVAQWLAGLDGAARDGGPVSDAFARPDWPPLPPPVRAALDRNDPAALAAALRSVGGLAVPAPAVRAITLPVHAVVGERDEPARADVEALTKLLPRVTVTVIAGADHPSAMADPRLAAAVRRFVGAH
jgi:pimeloyl-ACP methyl ester carboxylesterase